MEFKGGGLKNGIYLVNSLSVQTPCTVSDPFTCAALVCSRALVRFLQAWLC